MPNPETEPAIRPVEITDEMFRKAETHVREVEQKSLQVCEIVSENGGYTNRDTFLFAMHGIIPGRHVFGTSTQMEAMNHYHQLEERFGPKQKGKLVSVLRDYSYGLGDEGKLIEGFGVIPFSETDTIKYFIDKDLTGRVLLTLEDFHLFRTEKDIDETASVAARHELALTSTRTSRFHLYYSSGILDYTQKLHIGLEEMFAEARIGANWDPSADEAFILRAQMARRLVQPMASSVEIVPVGEIVSS